MMYCIFFFIFIYCYTFFMQINCYYYMWRIQVGVLAFAENVEYPPDPCYSRSLSLVTPANKEMIDNFITGIQASKLVEASYSNAFSNAFRLLATVGAGNMSEPRGIYYIYTSRPDFANQAYNFLQDQVLWILIFWASAEVWTVMNVLLVNLLSYRKLNFYRLR